MRPRPTAPLMLILAPMILFVTTGCLSGRGASGAGTEAVPAQAANQEGATNLPNDIHWARGSAERQAVYWQTYRLAGEMLAATVADLEPGTWAVALDADETVIDNSLYQKERAAIGEAFTSESWADWVARKKAPPLPGALKFLAQIHKLGGKIAIVTNRRDTQCPDTEANFKAFAIPFDVILCRQPEEPRKEPRWRRVTEGTATADLPPLDIVMWLGDNIEDFPNLGQGIRNQSASAFSRFGVDFFVLPNPMYGSWEENPAE